MSAQRRAQRTPPGNLEAEESLLGAMLLSREAVGTALATELGSHDFQAPGHGRIFEAITAVYASHLPQIDRVTVSDELKRAEALEDVGGTQRLVDLQMNTPSIGNAVRYARIVKDHATLRRMIGAAGDIAELAYSQPDDVAEAVDRAEAMVFALRQRQQAVTGRTIRDGLMERLDVIEARIEAGGVVQSPTGFRDLDELTAGLHPSELTLVAGRPGTGKTSWGLALCRNVAQRGGAVAAVSVEMSEGSLLDRLLASEGAVVGSDIRRGRISPRDHERIVAAGGRLAELPIWVIDAASATILTVRAEVRRALRHFGRLDLVVVDYVQIMRAAGKVENRQVEVAQLAQGLRAMAREMKIPVVSLAQLSRNLETRADKRPILADLRESGDLENTADVVIGLYRDEMYNKQTEDRGVAELIVLKQREGPTGTVRLAADMATGRWSDLSRQEEF